MLVCIHKDIWPAELPQYVRSLSHSDLPLYEFLSLSFCHGICFASVRCFSLLLLRFNLCHASGRTQAAPSAVAVVVCVWGGVCVCLGVCVRHWQASASALQSLHSRWLQQVKQNPFSLQLIAFYSIARAANCHLQTFTPPPVPSLTYLFPYLHSFLLPFAFVF